VAYVDDARLALRSEFSDHLKQASLRQNIKASRWLVHDNHRWLVDERHRDGHPLLLSAAELMRISTHDLARVMQLRGGPCRTNSRLLPVSTEPVAGEHFADLVSDEHSGTK
jgi:hypothetical protein